MDLLRNKFSILFAVFLLLSACTVEPEKDPNNLPLGVSAQDFLDDATYTSLHLEIVYVTGFAPTQEAVDELKLFLEKYTHKPDGVTVSMQAIPAPGVGLYSVEEVKQIEKKNRSFSTSGNKLSTFIFFADEDSESTKRPDKVILGKAYMNTSIVIFEKSVRETAETFPKTTLSEIEHTTIRHEFGHLFGLVDNGSPAQSAHNDSENPHHCNVSSCLMASSIEFGSTNIFGQHSGFTDFDSQCQLDLKANGGR